MVPLSMRAIRVRKRVKCQQRRTLRVLYAALVHVDPGLDIIEGIDNHALSLEELVRIFLLTLRRHFVSVGVHAERRIHGLGGIGGRRAEQE